MGIPVPSMMDKTSRRMRKLQANICISFIVCTSLAWIGFWMDEES